MIYNDVIIGTTDSKNVIVNKNELVARIGNGINLDTPSIQKYIKKYNENVVYRYAYTKINFKCSEGISYFEDEKVNSITLEKVLKDSKEVFLLVVTAGIGIDKLIAKTAIQNPVESFYIDAIASAGIESYIDYINNMICDGLKVTKRFSPGYADFPIEFQNYILHRVSANKNIGIMLSDNYLMIPTKSITAVIGIK